MTVLVDGKEYAFCEMTFPCEIYMGAPTYNFHETNMMSDIWERFQGRTDSDFSELLCNWLTFGICLELACT